MNQGNVMILENIFPITLYKQSKFCKHIEDGIVQLTDIILVLLAFSVCISPPLFWYVFCVRGELGFGFVPFFFFGPNY